MAIIKHVSNHTDLDTQGQLPDQFVSEKEKQSNDHIKKTLDFFGTIANAQVAENNRTFVPNYNLVSGILRKEDFYMKDNSPVSSFVDVLLKDVDLPEHVKHYSILNSPLSIMQGEQSKRPDFTRVKAYDDDSKNEELQFKTDTYTQFVIENAKQRIYMKLAEQGEEVDPEQLDAITMDHVDEYLTSYTSIAERWANRVLTACKAEFNFKEISEDCFRDLLIAGREFFHVYQDNSSTGFNVDCVNPKNVWWLASPDKKYTSDPIKKTNGAYAAGILSVMELGEIIQKFNLPKEEIDHLRKSSKEWPHMNARPSNFRSNKTGQDTIKYDTYSPLIEQERMMGDAALLGNTTDLNEFLGQAPYLSSYDGKWVVLQTYHLSKKKVGLLTYIDEDGSEQTTYVDDTYETIPNEVSIEWFYDNQWMKGLKIGHEIYHLEPLTLLDYCPIIGVVHNAKNTSETKSFVDLLKNFQTIYNIGINQIFKLLEKEYGNTLVSSLRTLPIPKDGDPQDAMDMMEEELRRRGILALDDSPENMKGASMFNQWKNLDLTRTNEINTRWQLCRIIKEEAWELVGISRARTGAIAATQTATGTQTELTQSYAQTEPYFAQHEYVVNQVYQALIDAAQHIAVQNPTSTISYISTEGEEAFLRINREDLDSRDLKLFVTSRAEDQKMFEELRQLAQPMLQNGASMYDVSILYATNSVRQMRDIFKKLKERQEEFQNSAQQLEQQRVEMEQQATQQALAVQAEEKEKDRQWQSVEKQLDRLSKERIAIISATGFGQVGFEDVNADQVPDIMESSRLAMEQEDRMFDRTMRQQEMAQKQKEMLDKNDLEREKLKVTRENMKNDLEIQRLKLQEAKRKAAAAKKKPAAKK